MDTFEATQGKEKPPFIAITVRPLEFEVWQFGGDGKGGRGKGGRYRDAVSAADATFRLLGREETHYIETTGSNLLFVGSWVEGRFPVISHGTKAEVYHALLAHLRMMQSGMAGVTATAKVTVCLG